MAHVTIPDQKREIEYLGQTGVGPYSFSFVWFQKADIEVWIDDAPLAENEWSVVPSSTITGGYVGGEITLVSSVTNATVVISLKTRPGRTTDFPVGGAKPEDINSALDKLQAVVRDLTTRIDRSVQFQPGDNTPTPFLPRPALRAGKIEAWSSDGLTKQFVERTAVEALAGIIDQISQLASLADEIGVLGQAEVAAGIEALAGVAQQIILIGDQNVLDAMAAIYADFTGAGTILAAPQAAIDAAAARDASVAARNLAQAWASNDRDDYPDNDNFPGIQSAKVSALDSSQSSTLAIAMQAWVNAYFLGAHTDDSAAATANPSAQVGAYYRRTSDNTNRVVASTGPLTFVDASSAGTVIDDATQAGDGSTTVFTLAGAAGAQRTEAYISGIFQMYGAGNAYTVADNGPNLDFTFAEPPPLDAPLYLAAASNVPVNWENLADNSLAPGKLVNAPSAGFIGATGAGAYSHRTAAQARSTLNVSDGAEPNPAQVSGGEITAGTETALRSFSPADVAAMAGVHGGGGGGGREVLTANRTYYVRTDGSDSNDGLANNSGGAFLTVQKAIDTAVALDLSIYNVVIEVADGTYAGQVILKNFIGSGNITLRGNVTTPANVLFSYSGSSGTILADNLHSLWLVGGFKTRGDASNGQALRVTNNSKLTINAPVDFGSVSTGNYQIYLSGRSYVAVTANYTISGGAAYHRRIENGSYFTIASGLTVTLSGTPAFNGSFVYALRSSIIVDFGVTYSGAATGKRYIVSSLSLIDTNGGGASYFPGDTAGDSPTTGAQYV